MRRPRWVFSLGFPLLTTKGRLGACCLEGWRWDISSEYHSASHLRISSSLPPKFSTSTGGQQKAFLMGRYFWSFSGEATTGRGNEGCQCVIMASEQKHVQNAGSSSFKRVGAVIWGPWCNTCLAADYSLGQSGASRHFQRCSNFFNILLFTLLPEFYQLTFHLLLGMITFSLKPRI